MAEEQRRSSMGNFWKNRRVLVTGVSGFLGGWLARLLLEGGADLMGYDVHPVGCLAAHGLEAAFPVERGSVLDVEHMQHVLQDHRVEVCIHLAGQSLIEEASA